MDDLYRVHSLVETMLIEDPETRNSDSLLYLRICERIDPRTPNMPLSTIITKRKDLGLPNIETVGRVRRKIQANNALLRATKRVEDARYERFKETLDYVTD